MEKITFPKRSKAIEVTELGMDYPGVIIEVWDDPSRQVLNGLMSILRGSLDEMSDEEEKEFLETSTRFLISSNIEGLEFNTVEETKASFENPDLPLGFLYEFIAYAIVDVFTESEKIKKALAVLSDRQSSGSTNGTEEKESSPA